MQLNDQLREEYDQLFSTCTIRPSHQAEITQAINSLVPHRARYQSIAEQTGVPWYVIAIIQNLEGGIDFTKHLYNGDPLSHRTIHVPAGQPTTGNPPFTWEESALGALRYDHFDSWTDWSLAGTLYKFETYNGTGYRPLGINSPYLWSFSNNYTRGKFVHDGIFDPNAVSDQIGAATLLRAMHLAGVIAIDPTSTALTFIFKGNPTTIDARLVDGYSWIAVRAFVGLAGGSILAAGGNPFTVTLSNPNGVHVLDGRTISDTGYVKARDLATAYGLAITFNGQSKEVGLS